jgi:hypothetical protein
LSEFLSSSPVCRLNRAEPFEEFEMPQSVIDLLEHSQNLRERTEGAFDCTVKSGPLSRQVAKPIDWDRERGVAWRTTPDAWLSFAAIGKGYALDRVRPLLERHGFADYLLNAGGSSIVFSGFSAPGEPWTWAWSWKKDVEGQDLGISFAHRTGERISVGVSGLHEKGKHLLDPRTGIQATDCQSALVAHPSAATADALSTALFVSKGGLSPAKSYPDAPVPIATATIDVAGIPRWNGWFQRFWGSLIILIAMGALAGVSDALADDAVDLGSLGAAKFNPYLFERHGWLVALPSFGIFLVLIHLIRVKRARASLLTSLKTRKDIHDEVSI